MTQPDLKKPKVGISACLMGASVRYNGNQVRSQWDDPQVASYFDWIPVCPEVGAGLGIPREPVHLVDNAGELGMVGSKTGRDVTRAVEGYAKAFLVGFKAQNPHGFILKKKSPSCGVNHIAVRDENGQYQRRSAGLFAKMLVEAIPDLPVEEDGRLNDPALRDNFFERVFAYQDQQETLRSRPSVAALMDFHARHKMALMARDEVGARKLGQHVASVKGANLQASTKTYLLDFNRCMQKLPSVGKHANVLEHLMGFVKKQLNAAEKRELLRYIRQFQRYMVPLSVPLTLLRHHLHKVSHPWVHTQSYLRVYPGHLRIHQIICKPNR